MRILIMTNTSAQAQALIYACLNQGIDVQGVIIEDKYLNESAWLRVKKQFRKWIRETLLPFRVEANTLKVLRFEKECEWQAEKSLQEYIQKIPKHAAFNNMTTLRVVSVNEPRAISFIESIQPDLVVVYGTGIIKPTVLKLAKQFVNAHSSILPYYRGSKSEFWQCFDNNFSGVGISIHAVDAGIDTGAVFAQFHQTLPKHPNPHLLRANNLKLMLHHYPVVIAQIVRGELQAKPLAISSNQKAFRMKDLTEDKKLALYSRLMQTRH